MSVVSVASAGAVSLEAYDPLAIDFRSPPAELSKAQIKKLKKRRKELLENKADSELLSKLGDEDAERCMKQLEPHVTRLRAKVVKGFRKKLGELEADAKAHSGATPASVTRDIALLSAIPAVTLSQCAWSRHVLHRPTRIAHAAGLLEGTDVEVAASSSAGSGKKGSAAAAAAAAPAAAAGAGNGLDDRATELSLLVIHNPAIVSAVDELRKDIELKSKRNSWRDRRFEKTEKREEAAKQKAKTKAAAAAAGPGDDAAGKAGEGEAAAAGVGKKSAASSISSSSSSSKMTDGDAEDEKEVESESEDEEEDGEDSGSDGESASDDSEDASDDDADDGSDSEEEEKSEKGGEKRKLKSRAEKKKEAAAKAGADGLVKGQAVKDKDNKNKRLGNDNYERAFAKLRKGVEVRGLIQGVESYGYFVTILAGLHPVRSLCHRNECDVPGSVRDLKSYKYKVGDRVSAVVLSADAETKKVAISFKDEHFADGRKHQHVTPPALKALQQAKSASGTGAHASKHVSSQFLGALNTIGDPAAEDVRRTTKLLQRMASRSASGNRLGSRERHKINAEFMGIDPNDDARKRERQRERKIRRLLSLGMDLEQATEAIATGRADGIIEVAGPAPKPGKRDGDGIGRKRKTYDDDGPAAGGAAAAAGDSADAPAPTPKRQREALQAKAPAAAAASESTEAMHPSWVAKQRAAAAASAATFKGTRVKFN